MSDRSAHDLKLAVRSLFDLDSSEKFTDKNRLARATQNLHAKRLAVFMDGMFDIPVRERGEAFPDACPFVDSAK